MSPSRNKTHSGRQERRPSGPPIHWARRGCHQRNSAGLRAGYAAIRLTSRLTSIGTRLLHTRRPLDLSRLIPAYTRIPFVGPRRNGRIHEYDVVLPRICSACAHPEIRARGWKRFVYLAYEWAEGSLVSGPHIQSRYEVLSQEDDIGARDAGIQVTMRARYPGERFDGPPAGDPPQPGVSVEEFNRIVRGPMPPGPI
jgi:hypothetical protein